MSDSTPNIDQYKGNYYIGPDEVQELRHRIAELERKCDLLLTAANTWQDKHIALLERLEVMPEVCSKDDVWDYIRSIIKEARDEH